MKGIWIQVVVDPTDASPLTEAEEEALEGIFYMNPTDVTPQEGRKMLVNGNVKISVRCCSQLS